MAQRLSTLEDSLLFIPPTTLNQIKLKKFLDTANPPLFLSLFLPTTHRQQHQRSFVVQTCPNRNNHGRTRPHSYRNLPLPNHGRRPPRPSLCLTTYRPFLQRQCRYCQRRRRHLYIFNMAVLVVCVNASVASLD